MKKNDATKKLLLEQLRKTPIIEAACQKVGIARMTFYRWKSYDQEFAQRVEKALLDGRLLMNDLAEGQLVSAIKDRNLYAVTYWLKHHHDAYKTRVQIEGAINTVHELSPEQEALMRRAFKLA
ncbi:MAG: hypothetical protein ABH846_04400, partial [Patescibacteria group bacterium]